MTDEQQRAWQEDEDGRYSGGRLGMTGREESWNYENDGKWFGVLSANEVVFACGEEHPTLSAQRALGLLVEQFGPDVVTRMVGDLTSGRAGTERVPN